MNSRVKLGLFGLLLANVAGQCDGTVNNGSVSVATTVRASLNSSFGEVFGFSWFPRISGDGSRVVFASRAANLHPDDPDTELDTFVRDLRTGTTILASRADGAAGVKAGNESDFPDISQDGRVVAFESHAVNLDPADPDTNRDIYLRNIETNTTVLASRATGAAGVKGNDRSFLPSLSADGRYVAFASDASNLHAADPDTVRDIFVRDLQTNTTTLVSRATGVAGAKSNGTCMFPRISADGRYVAFRSEATNLDPDDADITQDIYVRDLLMDTTTLVSRASGAAGAKSSTACDSLSISGDGRYVAFSSGSEVLLPAGEDRNQELDVFVRDLQTLATVRVSVHDNGSESVGASTWPSLSFDGRHVAFYSSAPLVGGDDNQVADVFVRDSALGRTIRASVRTYGGEANAQSVIPSLSADGRFVAFFSDATNMVDQDNNGVTDVFVRGPLN